MMQFVLNIVYLCYVLLGRKLKMDHGFNEWKEEKSSHKRSYRCTLAFSTVFSFLLVNLIVSNFMGRGRHYAEFSRRAYFYRPI
jgi:hypothetical protein